MLYPKISVVIGSYNRKKMLELCVNAIRNELQGENYEIIIVDGGSNDGTLEWLVGQKDIISIVQHNRGEWQGKKIEKKPWAYFMNLAFKCAAGKYICMLSDDSLIVPGAINYGVDLFDEKLSQNKKLGGVAFYFRDYPVRKKYAVAKNVGNLYINHGLYLNKAMQEVGYCDEGYSFYFSDTDLCLKIKEAGYEIIDSKKSFVEHYFDATPEIRSSNNKKEEKNKDRRRLIDKWAGKAYPSKDKEYYIKHVGRWSYHPGRFLDKFNTISRLILESEKKYKKLPLISVVTVCYNDPDGLRRTYESVRAQTYPFVQHIVIDGGSGSETQSIIKLIDEGCDLIVSEHDNGIYDAMNKGANYATGDYVIFMNSGDVFNNNKVLEDVHEELDDELVYGDRVYVANDENKTRRLDKAHEISYIKQRMPFCHQSVFYKREVLNNYLFNLTYNFSADYDQFVRMYVSGVSFKKTNKVICDFYAGGASESGIRPYLEVLKIQFDNFNEEEVKKSIYLKAFIKNFPDFSDKYM